jgi:hypothetical protein
MLKMETDDYADAQPISNSQQPDLLKMCRSRKSSVSGSPRTAKRRRTLNNTCSADEGDSHDISDEPGNQLVSCYSKLFFLIFQLQLMMSMNPKYNHPPPLNLHQHVVFHQTMIQILIQRFNNKMI